MNKDKDSIAYKTEFRSKRNPTVKLQTHHQALPFSSIDKSLS